MSGGEVSGVDLARVALRAARDAARKHGGGRKTKQMPRQVRTVRQDGREPMGLAAAIGALVTERAWELPAAGATLREQWAAIAPDLAGHVTAVGYGADSGQFTVCPESTAWATKTRLERIRVIEAANTSAGRTVIRAIWILPPGTVPEPELADADPGPAAASCGPVRTRENAGDGYRRALAAHRAAAPQDSVPRRGVRDHRIAAAGHRRALRDARRVDRLPPPLPPRRQHGKALHRAPRKRPRTTQHHEQASRLIGYTTTRDTTLNWGRTALIRDRDPVPNRPGPRSYIRQRMRQATAYGWANLVIRKALTTTSASPAGTFCQLTCSTLLTRSNPEPVPMLPWRS